MRISTGGNSSSSKQARQADTQNPGAHFRNVAELQQVDAILLVEAPSLSLTAVISSKPDVRSKRSSR